MAFLQSVLALLLSPWGIVVLAALDASVVFYLPLGIDMAVIYLAARDAEAFWLYPLLATVGSCVGAAITYRIGRKVGEAGLERLASRDRVDQIKRRVHGAGAAALAVPALIPPPFPFTAFVLTSGALEVSLPRFLGILAALRFARFGAEALLAHLHGESIIGVMESTPFRAFIGVLAVVAVAGTVWSAWRIWRASD